MHTKRMRLQRLFKEANAKMDRRFKETDAKIKAVSSILDAQDAMLQSLLAHAKDLRSDTRSMAHSQMLETFTDLVRMTDRRSIESKSIVLQACRFHTMLLDHQAKGDALTEMETIFLHAFGQCVEWSAATVFCARV